MVVLRSAASDTSSFDGGVPVVMTIIAMIVSQVSRMGA